MERERERKQKAERRTQTEINSERKKQNRRSYDHLGGATPSDRQRFYAPDVNATSSRRQRNVADVRPNSTEFLPNFSIQILLLSNPPSLSLSPPPWPYDLNQERFTHCPPTPMTSIPPPLLPPSTGLKWSTATPRLWFNFRSLFAR